MGEVGRCDGVDGDRGEMKLAVLGATGGTGLRIVEQALQRGHAVTAFVRLPERLGNLRQSVTVRQGDLLDATELEEAIRGHDAVVSGFGPRLPIAKSEKDLLSRFARALTKAMEGSDVRRAVVESTAFLFRDTILPPAHLVGKLFFPTVVVDASGMEEIFCTSSLDWTMVRPPQLTDHSYSGKYRVREGHLPVFGFKVSRANVAEFMVKCAENARSIRKVFGVSH
jgi:putative NADH-flavin reductase